MKKTLLLAALALALALAFTSGAGAQMMGSDMMQGAGHDVSGHDGRLRYGIWDDGRLWHGARHDGKLRSRHGARDDASARET